MKKIVTCLGFITLLSSGLVYAANSEIQEKKAVYQVAKNYATSIACSTTFESDENPAMQTTLKDILTWNFSKNEDELEGSDYLVFWGGDVGCAGGSGTYSSYLTSVSRLSSSRPFLVQDQDVLQDVKGINPRFIDSVAMTANKHLVVLGSDYCNCKADSGNNFPAYKYRYELAQVEGQWKLVNKKFLGKNS